MFVDTVTMAFARPGQLFERLPAEEKSPGALGNDDYSITGRVGKYVGWFGIVREVEPDEAGEQAVLTVEHKYFDGLTDAHRRGEIAVRKPPPGWRVDHMTVPGLQGVRRDA